MLSGLKKIFKSKDCGCGSGKPKRTALNTEHKKQMTGQSEKKIDKTIEQSFPASDPPTNY